MGSNSDSGSSSDSDGSSSGNSSDAAWDLLLHSIAERETWLKSYGMMPYTHMLENNEYDTEKFDAYKAIGRPLFHQGFLTNTNASHRRRGKAVSCL